MTNQKEQPQSDLHREDEINTEEQTVDTMAKEHQVAGQSETEEKQEAAGTVEAEALTPALEKPIFHFAGFWMRFWAYLLDLIVIGSVNRMIVKPLLTALDISPYGWPEIFSPYTIGYTLVFFLYFVLMTKFFGQTLGKMVFGLKVVSLKQESLSWSTIVFREFIGRFISKTIWITYIVVGILPKKQGLHDLFADTTVVLEGRR